MAEIAIKIDDQEERFPEAVTVAEALKSLMSGKQRKQTIAVYANNKAVDLHSKLAEDTVIVPIKKDSPEGLEILRHSTSHIMAQAVRELFGNDVKMAFITIFCATPRSAPKTSS
jgi:threonyl-tRNA synthetase